MTKKHELEPKATIIEYRANSFSARFIWNDTAFQI